MDMEIPHLILKTSTTVTYLASMTLTCVVPWLRTSIAGYSRPITSVMPTTYVVVVTVVGPLRPLVLALIVIFLLVSLPFTPSLLIVVLMLYPRGKHTDAPTSVL